MKIFNRTGRNVCRYPRNDREAHSVNEAWTHHGPTILVSQELLDDTAWFREAWETAQRRVTNELHLRILYGPPRHPDRNDWLELQPLAVRRQWRGLPAKRSIVTRRAGNPERGERTSEENYW